MLINLAAFIGNGLNNFLASGQHCGKIQGSAEFSQNTRTIVLHPVISFFYWNMNYHLEHHLYPGVPCYNLKKLQKILEPQLPKPTFGLMGLLKESKSIGHKQPIGDYVINYK